MKINKSTLRKIVNNDYTFTVFTKAAAVLIGLVASAFSKRFLGPTLEGEYRYINALLTTVAVVANFGLYQPLPYYKRQKEPDVLRKFLNIYALQFVIYAVVGGVLAVLLHDPSLTAVCLIAPIQVLANQLSFTIMVEDVKYKNVIFFTARIVNTTIIILAFFTLSPSLLVALALLVVGDLITIVLALRRLRHVGNPLKADLGFLRKILGFGFVAMLTTLLLQLNYQMDEMMLKWMGIAAEQRAFYGTGVSMASYGWLIPDAFREVLFSRTAKDDAIEDVTFSLKINFYLTVVMLVGIALLGKPMIGLLFGARYLPSFQVTLILLFGVLSMSYFKLIGTLLLAQGKKNMYLIMLAASVVVNIIANLFTIPAWGIEGAALSSVLSYTVAGAVFVIYFVRTYNVPLVSLFAVRRGEVKGLLDKLRK